MPELLVLNDPAVFLCVGHELIDAVQLDDGGCNERSVAGIVGQRCLFDPAPRRSHALDMGEDSAARI